MLSTKSRKGGKRTSSASTLKPPELLQKKDKSTNTRPRTLTKDIPNLYYTEDEIYAMKCNYRTERREERRIEKTRAMEEWKKKINRLYGDGITSYTNEDDMLVEECRQSCNMDDLDAQACLSWG